VHVRFWGTRGSVPTPGSTTVRYGGNTSCVEVRAEDGSVFVLDCGTGARALGLHLASTLRPPLRLNLFIGHTHWDHIQGFPFFVPAFLPGVEMNIYAPAGFRRGLEEAMAGQMEYSYFPVKMSDLRSRIHFTELEEGFFRVGDVLVETQYLNHTAPTIAYRITSGGATLAYTTDHEPFWRVPGGVSDHPGDRAHIAFLRGADLVIHDAQYSDEEYAEKVGWGHSPVEYATDVALAAGARRLALFHHDPTHDDAILEGLEIRCRERVARAGGNLEVFAGAEGLELSIQGRGASSPVAAVSALDRRPIGGGRVLLVSSNRDDITAIEQMLTAAEISVMTVPDIRAALMRGPELAPDLAIIDARLPDGEGATLLEPLVERTGRRDLPMLLLSEGGTAPSGLQNGPRCDVLAKPFSPPMLQARVRAWLARSRAGAPERPPEGPLTIVGRADFARTLAEFPLFRGVSEEQRTELVEDATEQSYPAGHVIVAEGTLDDRVFVVLSGRVRVVEAMPETLTEAVLGGLGEGEIFGELAALSGRPRSATIVAVERTHCLALRQARFIQALERSPDLALGLLRVLGRRLQESDRRLAQHAPDTLTGLVSRRGFHDQYRRLAAGARRRKSGLLLLLFDVLSLRTINDRFGYAVGDEVLRAVADALMEVTRATDLVARCGPDEFAVLLLDARLPHVELLLPRVTEKLSELSTRRGLAQVVRCRVGTAFRDEPSEGADELLRLADEDMRGGRLV
jgi:diguanylate cyclase (GGDEF)-like protein